MSTVADLTPGDQVTIPGVDSATFVAQTQHPLWSHLQLVIWRMADGSWGHDALLAHQDIGQIAAATPAERTKRLRAALLRHEQQEASRG